MLFVNILILNPFSCFCFKDAISQIGDNLTPSMPDKSEATSPFKFNSPPMVKKWNVRDTNDFDEYDNVNSSTKVPRLISKVDGNTSLLIPKLEKWFQIVLFESTIFLNLLFFFGFSLAVLLFVVFSIQTLIILGFFSLLISILCTNCFLGYDCN